MARHLPGSTVTTAVPFSIPSVNASTNTVVHSVEQSVVGDTLTCPLCFKKFAASACNVLWRHINTDHISRRCFPPAEFFTLHSRLICSVGACRWASHSRFRHSGCQRKLSTGSRCRGALVEASTVADLLSASQFPDNDVLHEALESSHISSHVPDVSFTHSELISIAIEATETLHLSDEYVSYESQLVNCILNSIRNIPAVTVTHIPRSIRPLFSQVLCSVLKAATQSIWGFVQLALFPKAVLRAPAHHSPSRREVPKSLLKSHLKTWQSQGGIVQLWKEIEEISAPPVSSSVPSISTTRALHWARLGRLGNAIKALSSSSVASPEDSAVQAEILRRHPEGPALVDSDLPDLPPAITVTAQSVFQVLKAFPKGSSPGGFQLQAQHLLDAVSGFTAPAAQECLHQLTRLINFLLSGQASRLVAPWLCGAPITALHKKNGGVRPIAVCETIRRLVSCVCCLSVKDNLPDLFLPYGQVGVGIKGGLEAAIHSFRHFLHSHKDNPDLCAVKLDMYNAFNEVQRTSFLWQLERRFPGIYPWVKWCYQYPANLQLGPLAFQCSRGVQQGDPLGPLLFSLVLLDFMDSIDIPSGVSFQLWYLDDGTFAGTRSAVAELLELFRERGPSFGLTLNLKKCEVFWGLCFW